MLKSAQIIAFSSTTNRAQALEFYRDKLGLKLTEDSPFALVFDANGTMLRVQMVKKAMVASYTALGWQVPHIGAAIRELSKVGIQMERFDGMNQDEMGVWSPPGGSAKIAWFKDPEGHTLSLTEF